MPNSKELVFVPGIEQEVECYQLVERDYFPRTIYILANDQGQPLGWASPQTPIIPVFSTEHKGLRYRLFNEEFEQAAVTSVDLEVFVAVTLQEVLVLLDPAPNNLKEYSSRFIIGG